MASTVQFKPRKGTTINFSTFKGVDNELCVDTTKKTVVVMDGNTDGGFPLAKENLSNVTISTLLNKGLASDTLSNVTQDSIINKGIAKADLSNVTTQSIKDVGIALSDASNIQQASTTQLGVCRFATNSESINSDDTTIAINPVGLRACLQSVTRIYPPMFIEGLNMSWESNNNIVISTGSCRSKDDVVNILVTVPLSISFTNTEANTTYHIFVASNSVGSIVCRYYSTLIPTDLINQGYTHYRRVGSVTTDDTGNILPFTCQGNTFYYSSPISLNETSDSFIELDTKIPNDIMAIPLIYMIDSCNIGIFSLGESNMNNISASSIITCFYNNIGYKGSLNCKIIGYIDNRELD